MRAAPREAGLDALRAAGAGLVLFAHGGYFLFPAWPHYDAYVLAGWLGTEAFFALTGFLVMREVLVLRGDDLLQGARYAVWRLLRILPLFWVALLVHALLARGDAPEDVWRYVLLVQNLASPHPAFFGEAWNLPPIVLFSLFAPGLAMASASPRRAAWIGVAALIGVGLLLRAEWIAQGAVRWDEDVRKIVLPRLDACAWGALAALLARRLRPSTGARQVGLRPSEDSRASRVDTPRPWVHACAGTTAVLFIVLAAALFCLLPRDASILAKFATFTAAGIGMAALCLALSGPSKPRPLLARFARWGYPLYLANMPLLLGFALIGFGQTLSPLSSVLRFAAWGLGSIALAALLHYTLERPLLEWARRRFKPSDSGASSPPAEKTAPDPGD
jgi:peptidoglycan/LPS O-acetylase OafA/YrhL